MQKFLIILFTILFLFPSVFAFPFAYDFESPEILSYVRISDRVKSFQSDAGDWYVIYLKATDNDVFIEKYSYNFVYIDTFTQDLCPNGSLDCEFMDSVYWKNDAGNEYIRIVTQDLDAKTYIFVYDFSLSLETFTEVYNGGDGNTNYQGMYPALDVSAYQKSGLTDDEILLIWNRDHDNWDNFRYTNDNYIGSSFQGDGEGILSESYKYPTDLQVAWCNNHYYVGAFNQTLNTFVITSYTFDVTGELEYIGNLLGLTPVSTGNLLNDDWNFYVEETDDVDMLHIVTLDRIEKEIYFQNYECKDNGQLSLINSVHNDFSDLVEDEFDYDGNDIILKYDMEDLTSSIQDSSSNDIDGTYNGVGFNKNGVYASALEFDGSDDYIIADDNLLNITDKTFTIGGWFNFDSLPTPTNYMGIFNKSVGNTGYSLYLYNDGGQYVFYFKTNSQVYWSSYVSLTTDSWYNICRCRPKFRPIPDWC